MSRVILVRHGQANSEAKDEASYDRLSDLGKQQAVWLGEYLAGAAHGARRVLSGSLRRQRETAARVAAPLGLAVEEDQRLNEIDYYGLSHSMQERHALELPTCREEFLAHMPLVIEAWSEGRIETPAETFAQYEDRVLSALADAEREDGTMLVTSGGIIGMAMKHVLGLDLHAFAHILLQTHNSSMHRYEVEFGQRRLVTFNATPHLDPDGRDDLRTFV